LEDFCPVFIIHHPAKQAESYYKASKVYNEPINFPEQEIYKSFKFSRLLFDYFRRFYQEANPEGAGGDSLQWPIAIDGDDLVNNTERVTRQFCAIVQLDPAGVIYRRGKSSTPNPHEAAFKEL
jgi:hypothetical protein